MNENAKIDKWGRFVVGIITISATTLILNSAMTWELRRELKSEQKHSRNLLESMDRMQDKLDAAEGEIRVLHAKSHETSN